MVLRKKVCIDLRCLQIGHESRGIGMHARSILERLEDREDLQYIFYTFEGSDPVIDNDIRVSVPYTIVTTPAVKKSIDRPQDFFEVAKIVWHRYKPLQKNKPDIFLQFDFMLGMPRWKQTKTILIAYDLIPLLLHDEYLPTPLAAFRQAKGILLKFKKLLRAAYYRFRYHLHYREFSKADRIISISKDTAHSLTSLLGIPQEKITVAQLAPVFSTKKARAVPALKNISAPYFFYIGATDSRKRSQDLIAAYERLREENYDIRLVLAGKEFADVDEIPNLEVREAITSSCYREGIICLGYVDDQEKLWLNQHAFAFVFPTLHEGFGLPVLEAMQSGCPVISYSNSSIPEIAGTAAILTKNEKSESLEKAMKDLLDNPSLRHSYVTRGREQAKNFSWERHMELLLKTMYSLTSQFR